MLPTLLVLFSYKHLRMHPYNMVAYVLLAEGASLWFVTFHYDYCDPDAWVNRVS